MNLSAHPLQIGTLATWLSVWAAGVVGLVWHAAPRSPAEVAPLGIHLSGPPEIELGRVDMGKPPAPAAEPSGEIPAESRPIPAPPEMPAPRESTPLPDVPDLPAGRLGDAAPRQAKQAAPGPRRARSGGGSQRAAATGTGQAGRATTMSASARLAAGQMPAPSYPPEARRRGQTGTVVVEFTVDDGGRVISARAASPSPWPLLNNEAVRTVRRWKFPPGGVMTLRRPIVFQLR